jgi:hypothetical protein
LPTFPEIAELAAAFAAIWIGGVLAISGVDRVSAYIRHHRPTKRSDPSGWRPGSAQDL